MSGTARESSHSSVTGACNESGTEYVRTVTDERMRSQVIKARRPGARSLLAALAAVTVLAAAGCAASPRPGPDEVKGAVRVGTSTAPTTPRTTTAFTAPVYTVPPSTVALSTPPASSTTHPTPPVSTTPSRPAPPTRPPSLPGGGRTIIPRLRVVAFYGGPDGPSLGVLGQGTPEQAAQAVIAKARAYAGYGRPVQPAMELIATVAQGSPGPDGDYSSPVPPAVIQAYLDAAHRYGLLLILDFQPGRAEFLPQVRADESFLLDPSVSVGLDPEWKVGPHQRPGNGFIGSASAAGINAVGAYLSGLISAHHLPDKLLIVHQFALRMLPDRAAIRHYRGVEGAFHADGNGSPRLKKVVFGQLAFPRSFAVGFKLFLRFDTRVMTPAEVMALRPRPDIVTYQ